MIADIVLVLATELAAAREREGITSRRHQRASNPPPRRGTNERAVQKANNDPPEEDLRVAKDKYGVLLCRGEKPFGNEVVSCSAIAGVMTR